MGDLRTAIYNKYSQFAQLNYMTKLSGLPSVLKSIGSMVGKSQAASGSVPKTMPKELQKKLQEAVDRVVSNRSEVSRLVSNKRNISSGSPYNLKQGPNHTGSAGDYYKAAPGFKADNYDEMIKYRKQQVEQGIKQLNKARQEAASELGGHASDYGRLPKANR